MEDCGHTCRGVPDRAHLYLEVSANTARAVEQRRSLMLCASSRTTLRHLTCSATGNQHHPSPGMACGWGETKLLLVPKKVLNLETQQGTKGRCRDALTVYQAPMSKIHLHMVTSQH